MTQKQSSYSIVILISVLVLFVAGRFVGSLLFDYDWSFAYWQFESIWFPIGWFVLAGGLGFVLIRFQDKIGEYFASRTRVILGLLLLLVILILTGYDSVVMGFGNRRIGQIVQADRVIYRWFELGSIGVVSLLYKLTLSIFSNKYMAGLVAWKTFSYACTFFTMAGSALLVRRVTIDKTRRVFYFILLFFGSQTPIYFGFVGIEAMIPLFSIWFALYAMNAVDNGSYFSLIMSWLTVLVGVLMHASLAFLIPAALFVTTVTIFRRAKMTVPITFGLIGYAILIWLAYMWANSSLEYKTLFLFLNGKLPHSDYGLFDERHLYDMIQLLCLVAPLTLAIKWSLLTKVKQVFSNRMIMMSWMMGLGGLTWLFISDPRQSIVLELPRMVAYLAPFSLFGLLLLRLGRDSIKGIRYYLPIAATAAIFIPLTFVPSYTSIKRTEAVTDHYMDDFNNYYHDACVAYRDAYFVRAEYPEADRWERRMTVKSEEYLNKRGSAGLAHQNDYSDALRVMYQMAAANPYWADPRAQIASMQMQAGRFQMAKPYIDTCLMMEPYNKNHYVQLYAYYRSIRNLPAALKTIHRALELFPHDSDIRSDEMLINYGMQNYQVADSLATELYYVSDTLPFPYLVRGLIAAKENDRPRAINNFEKFIQLAPYEPETPMIQNRLDSLKAITEALDSAAVLETR